MLRQELCLAEDFASFFGSSPLLEPQQQQKQQQQPEQQLNFNLTFDLASFQPAALFADAGTGTDANTDANTDAHTDANAGTGTGTVTVTVTDSTPDKKGAEEDAQLLATTQMKTMPTVLSRTRNVMDSAAITKATAPSTPKKTSNDVAAASTVPTAASPVQFTPPTKMTELLGDYKKSLSPSPSPSSWPFRTPKTTRRRSKSIAAAETPNSIVVLYKSPSVSYTSTDHFMRLRLRKEPQGAWYSVDLTHYLIGDHYFVGNNDRKRNANEIVGLGIKDYCVSITQWKRLFVGLRLENQQTSTSTALSRSTSTSTSRSTKETTTAYKKSKALTPQKYKQSDDKDDNNNHVPSVPPVRCTSIRIRPDVLCGAVMDAVTQTIMNAKRASIIKRQGGHLQAIVTMTTNTATVTRDSSNTSTPLKETCTSFMVDAQLCTKKSDDCERLLLLRIYHWKQLEPNDTESVTNTDADDLWSPSSTKDINITTKNNSDFDDANSFQPSLDNNNNMSISSSNRIAQRVNLHLREACALIQKIESPNLAKKACPVVKNKSDTTNNGNTNNNNHDFSSTSRTRQHEVQPKHVQDVSDYLLHNYRACPSVLQPATALTLPALSPQDWPIIQASWPWVESVWDELEVRELTYLSFLDLKVTEVPNNSPGKDTSALDLSSSMPQPRFGAFPALPTLDVQYCSQLRRLSRELMIGQLLKAAASLEDYARQAELECANVINLLQPIYSLYGVGTPPLPKPIPLESYPLDYTPPQATCPPWGRNVMEALNQVTAVSQSHGQQAAETEHTMDSIAVAETAVELVFRSFQEQDDEEQSARLARKNLQVIDRLTNVEDYNIALVQTLTLASTPAAISASQDFMTKAENAKSGVPTPGDRKPWAEVPLLKWNLGVVGTSGTGIVTAHQFLLTHATYNPLIRTDPPTWFRLSDINFTTSQTPHKLLNSSSTLIHVMEQSSGREVLSFKPSPSALQIKKFLDVCKRIEQDIHN